MRAPTANQPCKKTTACVLRPLACVRVAGKVQERPVAAVVCQGDELGAVLDACPID
jgi:hypothetical protein